MVLHMIFSLSVIMFLGLLAAGYQFGFNIGMWFMLAALVVSPLLSAAIVLGIAQWADWSDRRARAKRIAKGKARKSSVSTTD